MLKTVPDVCVKQGQVQYYLLEDYTQEALSEIQKPQKDFISNPMEAEYDEAQSKNDLPQLETQTKDTSLAAKMTARTWIWLTGMLVLGGYSIITLLQLKKRLRGATQEKENVYISERITTPFVYGIFRPRIYLPANLKMEEKEYILLHEQIHIKRGDHFAKIAAFLALCLHWFNPLVWAAFFLSGKDMEMSCDEAVIRKIGDEVKKEYSTSLLALSSGKRIVNGIPLAFGEGETGSRIKNILRYKKPAVLAVVLGVVLCVILAVVLLTNPEESGETTGTEEVTQNEETKLQEVVFYGVVMEEDGKRILRIPGVADVDISGVDDVWIPGITENGIVEVKEAPYMNFNPEKEYTEFIKGDLVRLTFSFYGDKDTLLEANVQNPELFSFSMPAESMVLMWRDTFVEPLENGRFRVAIARNLLNNQTDAKKGDMLYLYHHDIAVDGQERELLLSTEIVKSQITNMNGPAVVWVEMSLEEVQTFLSEATVDESWRSPHALLITIGEELTAERAVLEFQVGARDGLYSVAVRTISKESRCIDTYVAGLRADGNEYVSSAEGGLPLVFAKDCIFEVNQEWNSSRFEEVSFEEFADLIGTETPYLNKQCKLFFYEGQIIQAELWEKDIQYGIGFSRKETESEKWYARIAADSALEGQIVLDTYYTQVSQTSADLSDKEEGLETVEVYTGDMGDGDSGLVLVKDAAGEVIYGEDAHTARAGWNNIYLCEAEGEKYLLTVHIEDREDYGEYSYQVFRFNTEGQGQTLCGSFFAWGSPFVYDDAKFQEWIADMEFYLENSELLLSSQDGELVTGADSFAQEYNYENLNKADY